MPRVNIYIRKEDAEVWAGITNKPAWLHEALINSITGKQLFDEEKLTPAEETLEAKSLEHFSSGEFIKNKRFDGPSCKIHGLPLDSRGKCLQKGCKYA